MSLKVGIIGGAGYAAGELISLLVRHPNVEVTLVTSNSQVGKSVAIFHSDWGIPSELLFQEKYSGGVDVLFLCGGHGFSKEFMSENAIDKNVSVIDLSMDFRVDDSFVYGLPELPTYRTSTRIANPGCFATAIQLALLPMVKQVNGEVHINATTGSSGAGQALSPTGHFSQRANNLSAYKVFDHQHEIEMKHTFQQQGGTISDLNFIPQRGAFTRGIFVTAYFQCDWSQDKINQAYNDYYFGKPFTQVVNQSPDLKQVVQTNQCLIHAERIKDKLVVTSVIDNLLKGAAGQAVQNMNNHFGFDETLGLNLKPSHF